MPLRIFCQCGQKLTVPKQRAGMKVACPVCNAEVTLPEQPAAEEQAKPHASKLAKPQKAATAEHAKNKSTAPAALKKQKSHSKKHAKQPTAKGQATAPLAPAATSDTKNSADAKGVGATRPQPRESMQAKPPSPPPVPSTPAVAPARPPERKKKTPPPRVPLADRPRGNATSTDKPAAAAPVSSSPQISPPGKKNPPPLPSAKPSKPKVAAKAEAGNASTRQPAISDVKPTSIAPGKEPAKALPGTSGSVALQPARKLPKEDALPGVEHDPGRIRTVYRLAIAAAVIGLAGMYPAIADIVRHFRQGVESAGVESWAWAALLVSGIQLVYAFYLVQLPDWSSTWVVMIVNALVAIAYAIGMGIALMARTDNEIILNLGLSTVQQSGYLGPWCCAMTLLLSLLTYMLIRTSLKWRRSFDLAMRAVA